MKKERKEGRWPWQGRRGETGLIRWAWPEIDHLGNQGKEEERGRVAS